VAATGNNQLQAEEWLSSYDKRLPRANCNVTKSIRRRDSYNLNNNKQDENDMLKSV